MSAAAEDNLGQPGLPPPPLLVTGRRLYGAPSSSLVLTEDSAHKAAPSFAISGVRGRKSTELFLFFFSFFFQPDFWQTPYLSPLPPLPAFAVMENLARCNKAERAAVLVNRLLLGGGVWRS